MVMDGMKEAVVSIFLLVLMGLVLCAQDKTAPYANSLQYNKWQASPDSKIVWIKECSIFTCYRQCRKRKRCASFSYIGLASLCMLHKDTSDPLLEGKNFIYSSKTDWDDDLSFDPNHECDSCGLNEVCFPVTERTCQIKECDHPSDKAHAQYKGNMYRVGDKVKYFCNTGTSSNGGNGQSVCEDTGNWTENELECTQPCLSGWTPYGNKCYLFVNPSSPKANISEAQAGCQNQNPSADLAIVTEEAAKNFFLDTLLNPGDSFFICVNGQKTPGGTLETIDGAPIIVNEDINEFNSDGYLSITPAFQFVLINNCPTYMCEMNG